MRTSLPPRHTALVCSILICTALVTHLNLMAQTLTWTNFSSSPQAVGPVNNWSPNGTWVVGNAITAGAFDFQVDFPSDFVVTVQKATGTGSGLTFTLTNPVATIMMGDTNGDSAFTLGNGGANVARLSFPNGATIEKRGNGNDTISSSRMIVTSNLNVNFTGGSGTLMLSCTDGKSIYAQEASPLPPVALNVSGPGTLILANRNDHSGGTFVSQASVQFAADNSLGSAPASLSTSNLTIGAGGGLKANGSVALNMNRGIRLAGGGVGELSTMDSKDLLTVNGPITSDTGSPSSLTVAGPGTIALMGANVYETDTTVTGGTLMVNGSATTISNAASLVLAAGTSLLFDFPSGDSTAPPIRVGTVNPSAPVTINITGVGFSSNQIPLIKYSAGLLGGGYSAFALGSMPPGVFGTLVNNTGNSSIDLLITNTVDSLTWRGDLNSNWDINNTANWLNGITPAVYKELFSVGDVVFFTDSASNGIVNVTQDVKPAALFVENTNITYQVGGAGAISGAVALTKSGPGILRLTTANTFSGGVTVAAGALEVGHNDALGTGQITLSGGTSKLSSDGTDARTFTNPLSVVSATTLGDSANTGPLAFDGACSFGSGVRNVAILSEVALRGGSANGSLNKSGAATLTLIGGTHNWAGNASVQNGTLLIDGAFLTNNGYVSADAAIGATARVVITNGAAVVLTGSLAELRAGSPDADNLSVASHIDIAGLVRMPNAQGGSGRLVVGRGSSGSSATLWPGGDIEVTAVTKRAASDITTVNFDGGILRAKESNNNFVTATYVNVNAGGAVIDTAEFDITINPANGLNGVGGLIKLGSGTLRLTGANNYSGSTVVSNGTLRGAGVFAGPVIVRDGATLSPGAGIGTMTINSDVSLQGTTLMEINKDLVAQTNDLIVGVQTLQLGGTLTVANLGTTPLAAGDSFQLFSAATPSGSFSATNLPPLSGNLAWVWTPASGILSVVNAGATTPTNITCILSGATLDLTWPGSHLGWYAQSNSVSVADANSWFDIPGSQTVTNLAFAIDATWTNVFYRLRLP